jgi:hypothetical protein
VMSVADEDCRQHRGRTVSISAERGWWVSFESQFDSASGSARRLGVAESEMLPHSSGMKCVHP